MAQSSDDLQHFDPSGSFKFRVKWDGRYVAGVSKVSGLARKTEVIEHRAGGDPTTKRKLPGSTEFEPVMLERGVIHDVEFERWANKLWVYNSGSELGAEESLADYRKDVLIELYDEAGQVAASWKLFRCWVSELQSLGAADANATAIAIKSIKLENEGWERGPDMVAPATPSFTEPQ